MRKNEFVTVTITDMTNTGEGIGRADGYTLFVQHAVPGDTVRARITRPKKGYAYARAEEILEASGDRVTPACPSAGPCGGCTLQCLSYEAQLRQKKQFVERNLSRIGGFRDLEVCDVIGMDDPWRYRNKAQYPVGTDAKTGRITAGYYAARTHSIIPQGDCLLTPVWHGEIVAAILAFAEKKNIPAYDEKTGEGLLRHILIRDGFRSGETMVCLVLNGDILPEADALVRRLLALPEAGPRIRSICINVNEENTNVILGRRVLPVYGEPLIRDTLCGCTFRISPLSFFQVNPAQTEKLYGKVKEFAGLTGKETVYDLYCGAGTIGLTLSADAREVYGVESVPQAVEDAIANAAANGAVNTQFFAGKAEEVIREGRFDGRILPRPDVVIVDPPRKGCDRKLLDSILAFSPERIVYVSCDSATLARDLKILCEDGKYAVRGVQPYDLFPQTCHVETAVLMTKK